MNLDKLKEVYGNSKVVPAICDHMARRENNQNETKLHRMLMHLTSDGHEFRKPEIIAAFRTLEEVGCGRYVEGRRGWRSRFVWEVKSLLVAEAAQGKGALERDAAPDAAPDTDEDDLELVEHTFILRPGLAITLELPSDLTTHEASRVSSFVNTLPFGDGA